MTSPERERAGLPLPIFTPNLSRPRERVPDPTSEESHVLSGVPEGRTRGTRMQPHLSRRSSGLATRLTAAAAMLAVATITQAAEKRVIYVDKSAPPGGDGTSWQKAFSDPQDAFLSLAEIPELQVELRFAQGVYTPALPGGDRRSSFFIPLRFDPLDVTIRGSYVGRAGPGPDRRDLANARTVWSGDLNGDDAGRANRSDNAFVIADLFTDGNILIDGVTVRGATSDADYSVNAAFSVSAIAFASGRLFADVAVLDCIFEDNHVHATWAAALLASSDFVTVSECVFRNNRSTDAGSGALFAYARPGTSSEITRSLFESNEGGYGGAIRAQNVLVRQSQIVRNHAKFQGGGVFTNSAVTSSLLLTNRAEASGGAIAGAPSQIGGCTIVENSAKSAGAIFSFNGGLGLRSSILWANSSDDAATTIRLLENVWYPQISFCVIERGMSDIEYSGIPPRFVAGITTEDPAFIRPAGAVDAGTDWKGWNYRLLASSPARGAAPRGSTNGFDLDGRFFDRYRDPRDPDIGCYFLTYSDCFADLDRSWPFLVDDSDFQLFAAAYELTIAPPANPLADLNNDGLVDDADFSLFAVAYDALVCP